MSSTRTASRRPASRSTSATRACRSRRSRRTLILQCYAPCPAFPQEIPSTNLENSFTTRFVHCPLERQDELRNVGHRLPAPGRKLGLVMTAGGMRDVDRGSAPTKRSAEPSLCLPPRYCPPSASPSPALANLVREPFVDLAEALDRADAGLLVSSRSAACHGSSPGSTPPCGICDAVASSKYSMLRCAGR